MRKPSPTEPVTQLKRIPIEECGEPLVPYLRIHPRVFQAEPRWQYKRVALARQTVVEKLMRAADSLPSGYALAVIEGWRPPHIQRRMWLGSYNRWKARHPDYSDAALRTLTNRFTAPIHNQVPPPHTTGGAVDVLLADEHGQELDMVSPFAARDRKAYPTDASGISEAARRHRDILAAALIAGGISNYPSEYWHWSHGDQGWAYREHHPFAIYGQVLPDGWNPDPAEQVDEPLEFLK